MQAIYDYIHGFAISEISRLALTSAVLLLMPLSLRFGRQHLASREGTLSERRERMSIWRNVTLLVGFVTIFAVWSTRLTGFALSMAAVAGAVLIVSKEALMNVLGFINLTVTKPFGFGDYIEIGTSQGRVVDINAMSTTVVETHQGHQVTGATIVIPNSLVITQPVRNLSVTGKFVVNLLWVRLTRSADILKHEAALLAAADVVCCAWKQEADEHLTRLENDRHVDLPSAAARVIIEMHDGKFADLTLRYPCRPNDRVKVEQEILRLYLEMTSNLNPTEPEEAE